jgi:hypothetical protein
MLVQVLNGLHCLTVNWKDALGVHQHDHALVSKEDCGNFKFIDGHQITAAHASRTADGTVYE